MIRWRQRLTVNVALATIGGGMLGALATLLATLLVARLSGWNARTNVDVFVWVNAAGVLIGAASGGVWWADRQARTLRVAVLAADAALAGRALSTVVHPDASEATIVAHAVLALVERAERSTRELSQRQAYAAVGGFATELARELAPSVAAARSAIRTLEGHLHIDSPFHPPLARAQRELHRLSNTLQDTLRLARSGSLASRRLDLWLPLRAAIKTVSAEAAQRNIRVEAPAHGRGPFWVQGDQDALEQLFLNLLINGVQATDAGGRVDVQVTVEDDAVVTITDTGAGIPEGALERVFEPFYSTKPDRAGLGLAIAWRTAAAHGGKLSIESALGHGTVVHVALPRAASDGSYTLA